MSAADKLALAMIPEIEIWRAAGLMLKRYGEKALEESAARAGDERGILLAMLASLKTCEIRA